MDASNPVAFPNLQRAFANARRNSQKPHRRELGVLSPLGGEAAWDARGIWGGWGRGWLEYSGHLKLRDCRGGGCLTGVGRRPTSRTRTPAERRSVPERGLALPPVQERPGDAAASACGHSPRPAASQGRVAHKQGCFYLLASACGFLRHSAGTIIKLICI